jgi:hypothetical protein
VSSLNRKRAETNVPAPLDDRVRYSNMGLTKRVRRAEDPHSSDSYLSLPASIAVVKPGHIDRFRFLC